MVDQIIVPYQLQEHVSAHIKYKAETKKESPKPNIEVTHTWWIGEKKD